MYTASISIAVLGVAVVIARYLQGPVVWEDLVDKTSIAAWALVVIGLSAGYILPEATGSERFFKYERTPGAMTVLCAMFVLFPSMLRGDTNRVNTIRGIGIVGVLILVVTSLIALFAA